MAQPLNLNNTQNLVLPPQAEQMRWGSITFDTSTGPAEYNLAYEAARGNSLIPQSIIVNTMGVTDSVDIIWDLNGLQFPITIPPNVQQGLTVPAVDPCTFSLNPAEGCAGVMRLDLLNFPMIPENYGIFSTLTGQNVTVTNAAGNPVPISGGVAITGTASVVDTTLAGLVSSLSPAASGLTTIAKPLAATLVSGSATAAGSTTIGTPPANSNLRKLVISTTENAAQATAGEDLLTIALNGVTVFSESVYIPATALATSGKLYSRDLPFDTIAFNTGTAGTLTATLATALTSGSVSINAYFD